MARILVVLTVSACWTSATTTPQAPVAANDEPPRAAVATNAELGSDAVVPPMPNEKPDVLIPHTSAATDAALAPKPARAPASTPSPTPEPSQPAIATAPAATVAPPTDPTAPALDPSFTAPTPTVAAAEPPAPSSDATTVTTQPPHKPKQLPFYLSGRWSFGYGSFTKDGDSFINSAGREAHGMTAGGGVSIGWFVHPQLALGATLDFDPIIAPRGTSGGMMLDAEPVAMPNGTIGGMLAWLPSDVVATEFAATLGGGGVDGLTGGFGLILHGAVSFAVGKAGPITFAPIARVSVSPLMTDPVNGGSVTYWSVDFGVQVRAGAKR